MDACHQVEALLRKRKGILLVTGPTGSGKTTTLYALVQKVWSPHLNIVTVEDPVEYNMPGVNQVQVRPDIGLGFARCLRALLRQDPDLILVGEIRDSETAEIAFRAAMTGHMVLSTLHTQDAVSAMTRVLDLGVPRYVVSSTLSGVIAQRLVRRRCRQCSKSGPPVGIRSHPIPSALCPICRGDGLFGRIGVYEVLRCSEEIRTLMSMGLNEREIREKAFQEGMSTMMADGLEKVRDGLTTLEEVRRVLEE
jgi:type II secretory ATPase GspE/PulE/Tfp pilus assembly ATPase PilB-like protein